MFCCCAPDATQQEVATFEGERETVPVVENDEFPRVLVAKNATTDVKEVNKRTDAADGEKAEAAENSDAALVAKSDKAPDSSDKKQLVEFEIEIQRLNEPMNLDIVWSGAHDMAPQSYLVKKVKEGVVATWNELNSDKKLLEGDFILKVNGKFGKREDMVAELGNKTQESVKLLVGRVV